MVIAQLDYKAIVVIGVLAIFGVVLWYVWITRLWRVPDPVIYGEYWSDQLRDDIEMTMVYKRKMRRKSKLQQRRQRRLKQREQCRLDHKLIIRKRLHEPLIGQNIREKVKIKESKSNKFLIRDQMKKVISIRKDRFEGSDPLDHEIETAPLKDELRSYPWNNMIEVASSQDKSCSDPINNEIKYALLNHVLKPNPSYNGIVVASHKGKLISNSWISKIVNTPSKDSLKPNPSYKKIEAALIKDGSDPVSWNNGTEVVSSSNKSNFENKNGKIENHIQIPVKWNGVHHLEE